MKPLDSSLHDWMDARVEAYVDGELRPDERDAFEDVLDEHEHWAEQVGRARQIRDELHGMPEPSCPPQVTQAVLDHARRAQRPPTLTEWWQDIRARLGAVRWEAAWQPALAMSVLVALVVGSVLLSSPPDSAFPATTRYSANEIEQAEDEAKWAIAYIAQVGQETQSTLRREVIQDRIASPMRRALNPLTDESTRTSTNR